MFEFGFKLGTLVFLLTENREKVLVAGGLDPPCMLSYLNDDLINLKCSPILGKLWVQTWKTCFYKSYIHILIMERH